MKILQIIYESMGNPYGTGGAGIRAYEIYGRLKGRHDITMLCMRYPGASDGEIEGLRHVFAGTESTSLTKSVLAYTCQAARHVRRFGGEYDVIVENFLPSTPVFSRVLTRTPVILQVQGVMQHHALRKFNLLHAVPMYLVERVYPRFFRDFIFVSPVTRDRVLGRRRQAAGFCEVIPNGINSELLAADAPEGDYVLFFSRIDIYTKGLDLLMEAFARVAAEFPGVRLFLAGYEFDSAAKLREMLPGQVRERMTYAGFLTGAAKTSLLAGAKVVVLPSRHESAPISIVEAAACGRPVLVSDIPELGFVQEQGMGRAFRCGSAGDLAVKMAQLLSDAGLRRQCGLRGREHARRFLWDGIALRFEEALRAVRDARA